MAGCALASVGVTLAATIPGLGILYLASVLTGTGFMAIFIGTQHAVGTLAPPDERAASFSRLSLGFSVSAFAGPLIAGFAIDHADYSVAYLICGAFTLTDELQLCVSQKANGSTGLSEWLTSFHGLPLKAPQSRDYLPLNEHLEWHRKEVFHGPERDHWSVVK
jgi:MFS family permease